MQVRDKISSYDNNDMGLYNAHAKPIQKNPNQIHLSKDTLESEHLKRDAADRLNKTFVDSSVAYSIMKVSKFMFVIVAWPPYALLVELPKWMISQMVPIFMGFAKGAAKKAKKWSEVIAGHMAPVISFMKDLAKTIAVPLIDITQRLYKYTRAIGKQALNVVRTLQSYKATAKAVKSFTESVVKKVKNAVAHATETIKEPFVKLASKVKSLASEAVQKLASTEILQTLSHLPQVVVGWFALPMLQPLTLRFERAQNVAENVTAKMAAFLASYVKNPLSIITTVFQAAMSHTKEFLGSFVKKGFDFLRKRGERYVEWAKAKSKKLNPFTYLGRFFASSFFAWIPNFIRKAIAKAFNWVVSLSFIVTVRQGFSKIWNSFLELPLTMINGFIRGTERVWKVAADGVQILGNAFKSIYNAFERLSYRIVYWALTLSFMAALITAWSVQLLGRVTGNLRSMLRT